MSTSEKKKKDPKDFYIPPHSHCKVCGKAIPEGQIYCSKECRDKDLNQQKKEKNTLWVIYGVFIAMLVILLVVSYFFK